MTVSEVIGQRGKGITAAAQSKRVCGRPGAFGLRRESVPVVAGAMTASPVSMFETNIKETFLERRCEMQCFALTLHSAKHPLRYRSRL